MTDKTRSLSLWKKIVHWLILLYLLFSLFCLLGFGISRIVSRNQLMNYSDPSEMQTALAWGKMTSSCDELILKFLPWLPALILLGLYDLREGLRIGAAGLLNYALGSLFYVIAARFAANLKISEFFYTLPASLLLYLRNTAIALAVLAVFHLVRKKFKVKA